VWSANGTAAQTFWASWSGGYHTLVNVGSGKVLDISGGSGDDGWHSHDANNFWDYGDVLHLGIDDCERGDLISWEGHIAIYLGDDTIIEAALDYVEYNSVWAWGTPRGVLRLFQ